MSASKAEKRLQQTLSAIRGITGGKESDGVNRLIYERLRLAIVSALAVQESLSFSELKALLDSSDGNLSVHTRKLEEAGLIRTRKRFAERVPRTEYSLTARGRRALEDYLTHMEQLVNSIK